MEQSGKPEKALSGALLEIGFIMALARGKPARPSMIFEIPRLGSLIPAFVFEIPLSVS